MGEVLILIIIALVWGFKAAVANEDKKVDDRETGSISASRRVDQKGNAHSRGS